MRACASSGRSRTNTYAQISFADATPRRPTLPPLTWRPQHRFLRPTACPIFRGLQLEYHTRNFPTPTPSHAAAFFKRPTPPFFANVNNIALAHTHTAPSRCLCLRSCFDNAAKFALANSDAVANASFLANNADVAKSAHVSHPRQYRHTPPPPLARRRMCRFLLPLRTFPLPTTMMTPPHAAVHATSF